jgi:predicted nucleic acid-binding protein
LSSGQAATPITPALVTSSKASADQRLGDLLLTTNHVVFETMTLARRRAGLELALAAGERLYVEKMARIHWATPDEEKAAFVYLGRYRDKH